MFQRMSRIQKIDHFVSYIFTSPFMKKINSSHTHSDLYHLLKKPAFSVDSLRLLAAIFEMISSK